MDTNDVVVTYFDPNPSDNRWGLDKEVGVIMIHTPTGISSECGLHASRAENRISANYKLNRLLKEYSEMPSGSDGADPNYPHIVVGIAGPGYAPIVTHDNGTMTVFGASGGGRVTGGIGGGGVTSCNSSFGVSSVFGGAAEPSTFSTVSSINFHGIDMEQVKSDLNNSVIICRATLSKVIDIAYQAQQLLSDKKG